MLSDQSNIAEGPGFNVFISKDGHLGTPEYSVLPCITRRTVMDLCHELGLPCEARDMTPQELINADEVFITSTAGGVMPVNKIDSCDVGDGQVGSFSILIKYAYWRNIKQKNGVILLNIHKADLFTEKLDAIGCLILLRYV